jgi:hypothetical protein
MHLDLTVVWIEIGFIRDLEDLICPKFHEQRARRPVALAEAVVVADGPTANRSFTREAGGATDGAETFAFGHP